MNLIKEIGGVRNSAVAPIVAPLPFGSYNTGYTAHFVRPNAYGTSHSPIPLSEIRHCRNKYKE